MVEVTQNTSNDKEIENQPETQPGKQEVSKDSDQNVEAKKSSDEQSQEKMLSQSEVNRIVGAAKLDALERGKREALAEANANKEINATVDPNDPEKITVSKAELEQVILDTATKRSHQEQAERVVNQFVSKMQLGMQKYSDFETVAGKLNIPNLPPQLIDLVTAMDNTADIVYELGKNPTKFANVLNLCNYSPQAAHDELVRLSDSIKKNQEAAKKTQAKPNEPLDQAKPSTAGTDDGELKSVSDFRKQSWLRG